ncbi:MAG: hypothetical protein RLZZ111_718 [Planctomycetota bacterium]
MMPRVNTVEAVHTACGVGRHALVEARLSEIGPLRDRATPPQAPALPPRFLRHADEQTVVGVRAVLEAMAEYPTPRPSFTDYGVVAAPCRAGRFATAQSLAQARVGGGVAVSPHVVPQCSLHALAGSVSVACGMHGPNVGSSGGDHAVAEGLFTAVSLLAGEAAASEGGVPGMWLVLSGWDREPELDEQGRPFPVASAAEPVCRALAVALTADVDAGIGAQFAIRMTGATAIRSTADSRADVAADILSLARALAAGGAASWSHPCPWPAELVLEPARRRAVGPRGETGLPAKEAA